MSQPQPASKTELSGWKLRVARALMWCVLPVIFVHLLIRALTRRFKETQRKIHG